MHFKIVFYYFEHDLVFSCCRKTAVRNGDQLLDFLYRNSFGANQRLALTGSSSELRRFHMVQFSGSSSRRMFCSNGFDTRHVVCTDLLCVVCIGLLSAEFSTVNTELRRPIFGNLCVCEYS